MADIKNMPLRIALVGIGKIARDQHLPALAANPHFALVATASRSGGLPGLPNFTDVAGLIASGTRLDAVALCTPPAGRDQLAAAAIAAGLHVMLEKPPGTTVEEVEAIAAQARARGVSLFASWHSREAPGVAPARDWLAGRRIDAARIVWREDIRRWHPGQEWILGPGGFGVFDPGINALSIVTAILPGAVELDHARLELPKGRASPIAAQLQMHSGAAPVTADFDFRQTGPQSWDIAVDTGDGTLLLADGGSRLSIAGSDVPVGPAHEYPGLYRRFAALIAAQASDVDLSPLRLALQALASDDRIATPAFAF